MKLWRISQAEFDFYRYYSMGIPIMNITNRTTSGTTVGSYTGLQQGRAVCVSRDLLFLIGIYINTAHINANVKKKKKKL